MNEKVRVELLSAAVAGVLFAGGFFAGRASTPEKVTEVVKTEVKVVEVEKQVVVEVERVKIERVAVADTKQRIHREEHIVEHPNGLKETRKSEDINTDKVVKEHAVQYVDREVLKVVEKTNTVVEKVEVTKIVENRAQWHAAALVGTNTAARVQLEAPYINPLLIGIHVERRVIGPVFFGVWGTTPAQNPSQVSGGLSVGVEW